MHRTASARPRLDIARAVQRLASEVLVPVSELRGEAGGVSEQALVRWAVEGRGGKYLDAVHRPGTGWMSSREAVMRFMDEG